MAAFKCSVLHCPPCNAGLCAEKVIAETRSTVIDMITSKDDSMQFLVTIAYIAVVNQYSSHLLLLLPVNTSDLSSPFVYKLLVCWFLADLKKKDCVKPGIAMTDMIVYCYTMFYLRFNSKVCK